MYAGQKHGYEGPPTGYGPPGGDYGYGSPPPGSYYAEEGPPQLFYKWTSPPGVVRILEAVGLLLCLAIFACVASTLAWEYGYGGMYGYGAGGGAMGGSYSMGGSYYGGGLGSGLYGGGYYGGMTNPRAATGFMIAMSVLCFVALLALAVASLARSAGSRSRRFYLAVIVTCALLAFVMLVASIVYIMGVNPRAQSYGSSYYGYGANPMLALCNQVYATGAYFNQYLYHYCVVDPQEAIAIVCGFLLVILLCIICVFAHKTRQKIWRYGKANIFWDQPPAFQEGPDVEEWVKNVNDRASSHEETATLAYSEKPTSPTNAGASPYNYRSPEDGYCATETPSSPPLPASVDGKPGRALSASPPAEKGREAPSRPSARRGRRRQRGNPEAEESQYETDYTTTVESGDERAKEEWRSLYPAIASDAARQRYKQEFDSDLKRYKGLCADMDAINDQINQLSRQLDRLAVDSLPYQGVAEEYNRLKDLKRTADYQSKKVESRSLRHKLFHIKQMVSDYDKHRG